LAVNNRELPEEISLPRVTRIFSSGKDLPEQSLLWHPQPLEQTGAARTVASVQAGIQQSTRYCRRNQIHACETSPVPVKSSGFRDDVRFVSDCYWLYP
jgi:hypothetical protein